MPSRQVKQRTRPRRQRPPHQTVLCTVWPPAPMVATPAAHTEGAPTIWRLSLGRHVLLAVRPKAMGVFSGRLSRCAFRPSLRIRRRTRTTAMDARVPRRLSECTSRPADGDAAPLARRGRAPPCRQTRVRWRTESSSARRCASWACSRLSRRATTHTAALFRTRNAAKGPCLQAWHQFCHVRRCRLQWPVPCIARWTAAIAAKSEP